MRAARVRNSAAGAEQLALVDAGPPRAVARPRTPSDSKRPSTPAPRPWSAVVLAIDPGASSGYALADCGTFTAHGELDSLDSTTVRAVVGQALGLARTRELPCVLVIERPWGGNVATVAGIGAARERWFCAWRECGGQASKVVNVGTSEYRGAVLGRGFASAKRDDARRAEGCTARAFVGREVGPDEAAAVCIARWAAQAAAVGRVLGKRVLRAAMEAGRG